jgi:hypothetical protein
MGRLKEIWTHEYRCWPHAAVQSQRERIKALDQHQTILIALALVAQGNDVLDARVGQAGDAHSA